MLNKIYLDYAASTPVDPRVEKAMHPYFGEYFGNPSSLHHFGQKTSGAVFAARRKIADVLGAVPDEVIFTGSATEANNLALRGVVKGLKFKVKSIGKPRIITLAIEHESVLNTCKDLAPEVETVFIPVDHSGFVDLKKFKAALNDRTILVSVMHANNEVGTVQPISKIAKIIRDFREEAGSRKQEAGENKSVIHDSSFMLPILHTDAAQSFQYLDCRPENLGVDLMTLSAHKIYGPKGIGALYVKRSLAKLMAPVITGGDQENGLRSGTENVPAIVGFGEAARLSEMLKQKESKRIGKLRDYFWGQLKKKLGKKIVLNGSAADRLPNNLNIYFPGQKAHELLIKLDLQGIAVSPGAACSTRVSRASYVLEAMGFPSERASGSLRFSLGRQTSKSDIDYAISVIIKILK